jgi:hypothetical protein
MKLHTIFTIAFLVLIGINVQSQNDDKITSRDVLYLTSGGNCIHCKPTWTSGITPLN